MLQHGTFHVGFAWVGMALDEHQMDELVHHFVYLINLELALLLPFDLSNVVLPVPENVPVNIEVLIVILLHSHLPLKRHLLIASVVSGVDVHVIVLFLLLHNTHIQRIIIGHTGVATHDFCVVFRCLF